MATSNSYDWNLNRDQLILMALQEINVLGEADTSASATQTSFASNKLNGMLKMWSMDGIKTAKRKIGYIMPALNNKEYKLGTISGSAECTNSYVKTTLSADEALGQTVLSVTSSEGMIANDRIGIELSDGTRQWTTIVSVDSSIQITVNNSLTNSANSGSIVISYTSKINKPLKILYAERLDLTTNTENELAVIGHDEYNNLPNKSLSGTPNNIYYDKQIVGARPHYSSLFLYPQPIDVNVIIKIIYTDAIQDLDSASDDLDLPQEWLYPVMWNLAAELAYSYGKFLELEKIQPKADMMYELLKNASYDEEPIRFKIKVRR